LNPHRGHREEVERTAHLAVIAEEIIMLRRKLLCLVTVAGLLGLSGSAAAQGRVSDRDLEKMMQNLKEDSKKFASTFKQDVSKSTIRKTSEEKTAKRLADHFPKQVEGMLNQFKSKRKADAALPAVYQSYKQLGSFMDKVSPSAKTQESWSRMKQEIDQISAAFNFTPPT
jgi:hypothetical protein